MNPNDRVAPPVADRETTLLTESVIDVAADPLVEREAMTMLDPLRNEERYAARIAPTQSPQPQAHEPSTIIETPRQRRPGWGALKNQMRLSPAGEKYVAHAKNAFMIIGRILAPIFLLMFGFVRGFANWITERNDGRLDLRRASVVALIVLSSLFLADLFILNLRPRLLPERVSVIGPAFRRQPRVTPPGDLAAIVNRNIFSADGFIPDPAYATDNIDESNAAPTQLQLALLATIVYFDPRDSLAAIKKPDEQFPKAYRKGDVIEGMGIVMRVARGKVFFRNLHTNRLEYVEMKQEGPLLFGEFAVAGGGPISRSGETEFNVQRAEIQRQTANLPQLLQQARAVPNLGPGGQIDGFKVMMIQPGSVFEQLGIKMGDVIKSVNGQPLDSPARAMELYNTLRESSSVAIGIERDGRVQTFSYSMN